MITLRLLILPASLLLMLTAHAEEFTPKITIVNHTSKELWLLIPKTASHLPQNGKKTFDYTPRSLDLSKERVHVDEGKTWCLIDAASKSDDNCWISNPSGQAKYRISLCTSPLITQSLIDQAAREQQDLIATIHDSNTQEFVGTVELVSRQRGYLGGIWHSTKSFVGSFFGRP